MNSIPDRQETVTAAARHAFQDLKQATRDSLIQPLAEGTREVVHTAQSGCHAMAKSTGQEFHRLESWAVQNPTRAAGLVFAAGVLTGICLFRR
ncbi:MAG: hypothetical protein U0984_11550 [Prosthecobacter sp.]|nr:hypothetical protein [Prosthecobacter sp.]